MSICFIFLCWWENHCHCYLMLFHIVSCLTKYIVSNRHYNAYKICLIKKSVKIDILIPKSFSLYRFYSLGNFDMIQCNTPSSLLLFKSYFGVFVAIWKSPPMYSETTACICRINRDINGEIVDTSYWYSPRATKGKVQVISMIFSNQGSMIRGMKSAKKTLYTILKTAFLSRSVFLFNIKISHCCLISTNMCVKSLSGAW